MKAWLRGILDDKKDGWVGEWTDGK